MNFRNKKEKAPTTRTLQMVANPNMPFPYVEAYKSLRTNIKFISNINDARSFVITSAVPEESKSNMAVNLAITLGNEGKKVIVIDCDLRKPVIHKYLKIPRNSKGLTNILSGDAELEKSIVSFSDINVDILVAGTVPPNPSELLASSGMKDIIEKLKTIYDYVIIDAPPVSVVTDAAIIGTFVDGAILVVRSKFASADVIKFAKKRLDDVNVKIFGVVITRFNANKSNKNSAYSRSYNYNYYRE